MRSKYFMILSLLVFNAVTSLAQCAMCKATLENQEEGSNIGGGINEGILFLMPIPYILLGIIGYSFYYRNKKRKAKVQAN